MTTYDRIYNEGWESTGVCPYPESWAREVFLEGYYDAKEYFLD